MAVKPDGSRLYVANGGSGTLTVIATSTNTVLSTIPVVANAAKVVISPNGAWVFVAGRPDYSDNQVSVIATASNSVVATLSLDGRGVGDMVVSPDSRRVFVSNSRSGTVSVIALP